MKLTIKDFLATKNSYELKAEKTFRSRVASWVRKDWILPPESQKRGFAGAPIKLYNIEELEKVYIGVSCEDDFELSDALDILTISEYCKKTNLEIGFHTAIKRMSDEYKSKTITRYKRKSKNKLSLTAFCYKISDLDEILKRPYMSNSKNKLLVLQPPEQKCDSDFSFHYEFKKFNKEQYYKNNFQNRIGLKADYANLIRTY